MKETDKQIEDRIKEKYKNMPIGMYDMGGWYCGRDLAMEIDIQMAKDARDYLKDKNK